MLLNFIYFFTLAALVRQARPAENNALIEKLRAPELVAHLPTSYGFNENLC